MSAHLIVTSQPEQCVDFYTRTLGLKLAPSIHLEADSDVVAQWLACSQTAGQEVHAFPMDMPAVFRIDHQSIAPLSREDARRLLESGQADEAGWEQVLSGGASKDIYFLVTDPIEQVHARILKTQWHAVLEPVCRAGAMHAMHVLHLLDPDGNRIRLVQLAAGDTP